MRPKIFISYASEDRKVAMTLCHALEARGQHCWISSRNVGAGQNYQEEIVRAIRAAKLMVLVFTAHANNSGEIKKELALASQFGLTVIPIRVEDVVPGEAFLYEFATRQWVDMFENWEASLSDLAERVATIVSPGQAEEGGENGGADYKGSDGHSRGAEDRDDLRRGRGMGGNHGSDGRGSSDAKSFDPIAFVKSVRKPAWAVLVLPLALVIYLAHPGGGENAVDSASSEPEIASVCAEGVAANTGAVTDGKEANAKGDTAYEMKDYAGAASWYRLAADMGEPLGEANLGYLYETGLGLERDFAKAASCYKIAADEGNLDAQNNLGRLYREGSGVTRNYQEAANLFRAAAEKNHARAQNNLGDLHENGNGVEKNFATAAEWYRKSADQGFMQAQTNLGELYEFGRGVPKDLVQAASLYRKAADQGHSVGQFDLALLLEDGEGVTRDLAEAANWYRKAADQGHAGAQNNLGLLYKDGTGVAQDAMAAASWFGMAADQGDARAQNNLGEAYLYGRGVPKDEAQAASWFRRSAEQGFHTAQKNLGDAYFYGTGVGKDAATAAMWFLKSAEQGYAPAHNFLGYLYDTGSGVTKDPGQAASWFRKAADQGNSVAFYNLGLMYQRGAGVMKSDTEAVSWFKRAAENGDKDAHYRLGLAYEAGQGVSKDMAQVPHPYGNGGCKRPGPRLIEKALHIGDDGVAAGAVGGDAIVLIEANGEEGRPLGIDGDGLNGRRWRWANALPFFQDVRRLASSDVAAKRGYKGDSKAIAKRAPNHAFAPLDLGTM